MSFNVKYIFGTFTARKGVILNFHFKIPNSLFEIKNRM